MSPLNRGNILFMLLIGVVLFAALSYAVSQSLRGGGKDASQEKAQLDQGVLDSYQAAVRNGAYRLELDGCETVDYTPPASQSPTGDKSCFVFHPDGAGVKYQDN